jgi:hypothetical protein
VLLNHEFSGLGSGLALMNPFTRSDPWWHSYWCSEEIKFGKRKFRRYRLRDFTEGRVSRKASRFVSPPTNISHAFSLAHQEPGSPKNRALEFSQAGGLEMWEAGVQFRYC